MAGRTGAAAQKGLLYSFALTKPLALDFAGCCACCLLHPHCVAVKGNGPTEGESTGGKISCWSSAERQPSSSTSAASSSLMCSSACVTISSNFASSADETGALGAAAAGAANGANDGRMVGVAGATEDDDDDDEKRAADAPTGTSDDAGGAAAGGAASVAGWSSNIRARSVGSAGSESGGGCGATGTAIDGARLASSATYSPCGSLAGG